MYRVHYDKTNTKRYFDVKQIATNHSEPLTPAEVFSKSSLIWKTSKIYNISSFYTGSKGDVSNNPIDPNKLNKEALDLTINLLTPLNKDSLPQSKYASDVNYGNQQISSYFGTTKIGNTEYYTNASWGIFKVNSSGSLYIEQQGYYYISLDGKYKTTYIVDNNKLTSTLVVSIVELSTTKLVYDVIDENEVFRVITVPK